MYILGMDFKLLNWIIPLWVFLVIFAIIGLIALGFFILVLFKKRKSTETNENVSSDEILRIEKFEENRNFFESELAKVKKQVRTKK